MVIFFKDRKRVHKSSQPKVGGLVGKAKDRAKVSLAELRNITSRDTLAFVMHLHVFTQTNVNIRTITQYHCHFRRRMFNVVGHFSGCSLYNLCRSAEFNRALDFWSPQYVCLWWIPCGLYHSEWWCVAFQNDCIASRMKNSEKMTKTHRVWFVFPEIQQFSLKRSNSPRLTNFLRFLNDNYLFFRKLFSNNEKIDVRKKIRSNFKLEKT